MYYIQVSLVNPRKGSSSNSEMLFKIGVLKKLDNITGKHLHWSLTLIKLKT